MIFKILLPAAIVAFELCSCDPCNNLDCAASNYSGQFRIIKNSDSSDLVFGSKKLYDKDQIKFYSINNNNDTNYFDYKPVRFGGVGYDSILYVFLYPQTLSSVYLKLSDTDTDTLTMTFQSFKTKCCGKITEIDKLFYNGVSLITGTEGTRIIKK